MSKSGLVVPTDESSVRVRTVSADGSSQALAVRYGWRSVCGLAAIAWCSRVLSAIVLSQVWDTHTEFLDERMFDDGGWRLAQAWRVGESLNLQGTVGTFEYGYFYWVGAIYRVVGHHEFVVEWMNALVSAALVFALYVMGRQLGDRRTGWFAALLWAVWPAALFWSGLNLKIHLVIAMTVVWMLALGRWHETRRWSWWLPIGGAGAALWHLQSVSAQLMFGLTALWCCWRGWWMRPTRHRAMFGFIASGALMIVLGAWVLQRCQFIDLRDWQWITLWRQRMAIQTTAFWPDVDLSSPGHILMFLPVGWAYLLGAPFPWALPDSPIRWATPEVILWYGVMLFAVKGVMQIRHVNRVRQYPVLLWLAYVIGLGSIYAVLEGNYGSMYRHRYQLMPWIFLLAAWGYHRWLQARVAATNTEHTGGVA